jgi:hypothetical protein
MTGLEAFQSLKDGKQVRRKIWTPDCYVTAESDDNDEYEIRAEGTNIFIHDVRYFGIFVLEQLLEDGDQWELYVPCTSDSDAVD